MKKNKTILYVGAGAIAIGLISMFGNNSSKATENNGAMPLPTPLPTPTNTSQPKPQLNQNLTLKVGVKGAEVSKLQTLLGINPDGIFGPITEGALYKLKGVKSTTLALFPKLPNVNQNRYPKGTRVMSNLKGGTPLYKAIAKADGSYYSNYEVFTTRDFGEKIGTIRSSNEAGNWYTVLADLWSGTEVMFVKASDIKSY